MLSTYFCVFLGVFDEIYFSGIVEDSFFWIIDGIKKPTILQSHSSYFHNIQLAKRLQRGCKEDKYQLSQLASLNTAGKLKLNGKYFGNFNLRGVHEITWTFGP